MGRFRPKAFFLSHYSKSVYLKNTYPHPKKTLGLEEHLVWMAFPQWQPGLSSEQVKFALGLKRPTITLTSVQTRFERQGKFLNFYEVYEHFRNIFLFSSYIDFSFEKIFFNEFSWSLWVFLEDFSFFLVILIFYFKKMFLMNDHEVSEYFWKIYSFFESYIDFSSLIAWRSVHPLKSWEFFIHARNESTIWTI